jgi:hypothetical protein
MVFGSDGNFTQDNLRAWDMGRRVSNRRAHEHLRAMRTEMDAAGQRWRCLDDDELLRDYVCSRPDAAELVGGGIEQAWGAFLGSVDQNHRLAPHVPVQRFDWVLIREDNTSARIHPSSKSHGVAVHGNLDQWLTPDDWHSAPAAMRGAAVMSGGAGTAFTGRHQCDVIGRNNAQRFLRCYQDWWEAQPPPRRPFFWSIHDGREFQWWLYLNSTPWGRDMAPSVEDIALCWLKAPYERPAFYVRGRPSLEGVIDALGSRPNPFIAMETLPAGVVSWS